MVMGRSVQANRYEASQCDPAYQGWVRQADLGKLTRWVFDIGLFYLSRVAIPQMRKQGKGSIIATASTAGLAGDYGLCSYSAAKAGTVNLIRTMALDHAREGIRVNCKSSRRMGADPKVFDDTC